MGRFNTCINLHLSRHDFACNSIKWVSMKQMRRVFSLLITNFRKEIAGRPQLKILLKVGINFFVLRTIFCCSKRSVRNTLWTLLDFKNCKPQFPLSFWSPLHKDYHALTTLVPCKCIPKFLSINVYVQPDRHQHFRLTCSLMDGSHVMVVIT